MIAKLSIRMLRRSFECQRYRFGKPPKMQLAGSFGVYVNVPLCYTRCSFCPFYKEIYSDELKERYLDAILREINKNPVRGRASWVYFGGGTPNTLSIDELERIVGLLKSKITSRSWGIELLPLLVTRGYLEGLKQIGFTKVSIGVESLSDEVITRSGRKLASYEFIKDTIEHSLSLGLWVNVDLMTGLSSQTPRCFLDDIHEISRIGPSQITIYPFMLIKGLGGEPSMTSLEQFQLIENAAVILNSYGYTRKGVWTFAKGDDVYDSSRDELIEDYIGFGPAAFSTYGSWKVVNPELDAYLESLLSGQRMAFVAQKTKATDEWRRFARMVYDLRSPDGRRFPGYIRSFITLLKLTGYIRNGRLTPKGVMFAHEITKSVVESLPFPVQNPDAVENYGEYLEYRSLRSV